MKYVGLVIAVALVAGCKDKQKAAPAPAPASGSSAAPATAPAGAPATGETPAAAAAAGATLDGGLDKTVIEERIKHPPGMDKITSEPGRARLPEPKK